MSVKFIDTIEEMKELKQYKIYRGKKGELRTFDEAEIAIAVIIEGGGTGSYAAYGARDVIAQYFGMNQENVTEDVTAKPYTEQNN